MSEWNARYKMRLLTTMTNNWGTVLAVMACGMIALPESWAETSLPIPRASSAVERELHDEALYLKEETVSIASRYEQPISQAPSDVYVITDEDIRNSGATDIPTMLRQIPGMGSHANRRGRLQCQYARQQSGAGQQAPRPC